MSRGVEACRREWLIITLREVTSPKVDHYHNVSIAGAVPSGPNVTAPQPLPPSRLKVQAITDITIYLPSELGLVRFSTVSWRHRGAAMACPLAIVAISSPPLSLASLSKASPQFMTLSFPHLIYLAADSHYLFRYGGDVCRVWPSHFTVLQGATVH